MVTEAQLQLTDAQLIEEALHDTDAFGVLIERYEKKLMRYILRLSNVRYEEAEELLQEVFIKVWRNLRSYDAKLSFSSWVYRITHNEVISFFRTQKARGADMSVPMDETIFEIKSDELDIPSHINIRMEGAVVREILRTLSKEYSTVLVLRFLEDKSYDEISDIIKKPMGTVATLINRAKKIFKEHYLTIAPSHIT